ncbi:hypothetical protein PIB30_021663, partial [Stylosanthes scabra]|nr:hypothetical protein [Stylosanthes scabra]
DSEKEVLASFSLLVDIDAEERLPKIHRGAEASSRAFTSPPNKLLYQIYQGVN